MDDEEDKPNFGRALNSKKCLFSLRLSKKSKEGSFCLFFYSSALYSIAIWPFDHLLDHLNFHKLPIEGFFSQTLAPSWPEEVAPY